MYHPALYSRLGALMAGNQRPKVVYSIHNIYTSPKPHRIALNMMLGRFTDLVIAVAEPVKDDIIRYDRVPEEKVTVLENGIDVDRFDIALTKKEAKERLGLRDTDFVLGCVARLEEQKGHTYMLKTVSMLKKSGYNFKLLLAGSGRLEELLRRECIDLGIESDTVFLGTRHDIPELYRAMDIYLMSSLWEGRSLSIMEAMAAGLPTVVTEVGGSADIVDNGRCGLLVPPKDPQAMADAIIKLYSSSGKRNELTENGKERARKLYSSDAMTKKLEELYEGLFRTEDPT
jgi:glycosyltransferase involved in cell wall biosynthesis